LAATSNQSTTKGIAMSYFAGKRILITGAGSGLGRRMALSMAREGGTIIGWDVISGQKWTHLPPEIGPTQPERINDRL
jgi:2-polyprenyl-3-methyl-5-hydroxy-6-metoxy-1,4-benzoquinol methylase